MGKIIIFLCLVAAIFYKAYQIVEPEGFGGYVLTFLLANVIAIAINFSFLGILLLLGLISKIFTRN